MGLNSSLFKRELTLTNVVKDLSSIVSMWILHVILTANNVFHGSTVLAEVSGSHSDTPYSFGLLRTSDRPVAETSA